MTFLDKKKEQRRLQEEFCFEAYKASKQVAKLYSYALTPYRLTFPQYVILLALGRQEAYRVKELQELLGISIGTLNPILTHLEKEGWVVRKKAEDDKRSVIVTSSPKATEKRAALLNSIEKEIHDSGIQEESMRSMLHHMKDLNETLERHKEEQKK